MNLTPRQAEIAELMIVTGSDRAVVCKRLAIPPQQLRRHLCDIRAALGVPDDAALMSKLRLMTRDPVPVWLERCKAEPRTWCTV